MKKTLIVALITGTSLCSTTFADTFPSRPITMIVPYAAGGSTDGLARVMAEAMAKQLKQPVIVENVGGGGGMIGLRKLMQAKPDGYTISLGNMGNFAIAGTLYPDANYDPRRDVQPVGLVAKVPMVLSVSSASGIQNLQELLKQLRVPNTKINIGHSGPGSTGHIASVYFGSVTNTNGMQIAYRGAGPAIADLMAGTVDVVIDQTVTMIPASKGGRVIPLAVTGNQRVSELPDTPTFTQAGVPEFDLHVWNAIVAPINTPEPAINTISKALSEAFNDPKVIAQMASFAAPIPPDAERGPQALKQLIDSEVVRFEKLIKDNNLQSK